MSGHGNFCTLAYRTKVPSCRTSGQDGENSAHLYTELGSPCRTSGWEQGRFRTHRTEGSPCRKSDHDREHSAHCYTALGFTLPNVRIRPVRILLTGTQNWGSTVKRQIERGNVCTLVHRTEVPPCRTSGQDREKSAHWYLQNWGFILPNVWIRTVRIPHTGTQHWDSPSSWPPQPRSAGNRTSSTSRAARPCRRRGTCGSSGSTRRGWARSWRSPATEAGTRGRGEEVTSR